MQATVTREVTVLLREQHFSHPHQPLLLFLTLRQPFLVWLAAFRSLVAP